MNDKIDKNSVMYKKYLARYDPKSPANIKKSKAEKKKRRRIWWSQNWLSFIGVLFAAIAAIPVISEGIASILKWLK